MYFSGSLFQHLKLYMYEISVRDPYLYHITVPGLPSTPHGVTNPPLKLEGENVDWVTVAGGHSKPL